ncbi:Protein mlp1 [Cryptotrichosporon argae]
MSDQPPAEPLASSSAPSDTGPAPSVADLRAEVEREQTVLDLQALVKTRDAELERLRAEKAIVEEDKAKAVSTSSQLQTQLASLQASHVQTVSMTSVLESRIEAVEREKRELVEEIQRLQERSSKATNDLYTLRSQKTEASRKIAHLDVEVSELKMMAESAKFNEDRSLQALQNLREENKALVKATTDTEYRFSMYRAQKQSELSELQLETETVQHRFTTLQTTHTALQRTYNEQARRLAEAHASIATLTTEAANRKTAVRLEVARLVEETRVLEKRADEARHTVEDRERELETLSERFVEKEKALEERLGREEKARREAEKRVDDLKVVVERLALVSGEGSDISPAASIAGLQRATGKSYTQIYTDYTILEHRLREKEEEVEHFRRILEEIDNDIKDKKPLLDEQAAEHAQAIERANTLAAELGTAISSRDALQSKVRSLEASSAHHADEVASLQAAADDLSRQVQSLLRQLAIKDDPSLASAAINGTAAVSDSGDIITDRLLEFASIRSLQEQNQRLLKLTRGLVAKLDAREVRRATAESDDVDVGAALDEATEAVTKLHAQLLDAQTKINEVTRERDFFSKLLAKGDGLRWGQPTTNGPLDGDEPGAQAVEALQLELDAVRTKAEADVVEAKKVARERSEAAGVAEVERAKVEARVTMLEEQQRMLAEASALQKQEQDAIESQLRHVQAQVAQAQAERRSALEQVASHQAAENKLRDEVALLRAEREQWQSTQARLQADFTAVQQERARLQHAIDNLNSVGSENERTRAEDRARLERRIEEAQRETTTLRQQVDHAREATRAAERRLADFDARLASETAAIRSEKEAAETLATTRATEIASLTEEVAKAKAEAEKVKQIGINWQKRARELGTQLEGEKAAREAASKESTDGQGEVERLKKEIDELRAKLEEANKKVEEAKRASELKDGTISRLQVEAAAKTAPVDTEKAAIIAERDSLQQRLAQAEKDLEAAKAAPAAPSTETAPAEANPELQAQLDEVTKQLAAQNEKYERDVTKVNRVNAGLNNRVKALLAEKETLEARIAELEKTVTELNEKLAQSTPSEGAPAVDDGKIREAVEAERVEWEKTKADLEAKLSEAEARAATAPAGEPDAAATAAQEELAKAKVSIDELEGKVKALNRQAKTAEITRKTLEKKLETIERRDGVTPAPGTPGPSSAIAATVLVAPAPAATSAADAKPTDLSADAKEFKPTPTGPAGLPANPVTGASAEPVRGAARGRARVVRGRGTGRPNSVLSAVNAALGTDESGAVKRPAPEDGEVESSKAPGDGAAPAATGGMPERGRVVKRMRGAARGGRGGARGGAPGGGEA